MPESFHDQNQYDHNQIELKWEQRWNSDPTLYAADPQSSAPKYYVVEMLPYQRGPSAHGTCNTELCDRRCARAVYVDARL